MEQKSIPPKSLSLDTYPFVCVQLPGKVASGKAPVAFKSQRWAFPDKNVVHYLCVSFQAVRLTCANFSKAWFFFIIVFKEIWSFWFSLFLPGEAAFIMAECTMNSSKKCYRKVRDCEIAAEPPAYCVLTLFAARNKELTACSLMYVNNKQKQHMFAKGHLNSFMFRETRLLQCALWLVYTLKWICSI